MSIRLASGQEDHITSERDVLQRHLQDGTELPTDVRTLGPASLKNPVSEEKLGDYRDADTRKAVTADQEILQAFFSQNKVVPGFAEAGPRAQLYHDPHSVRALIVTTGGLAPGLNAVIHSIVARHWNSYQINLAMRGGVFGVFDSFLGLTQIPLHAVPLTPEITEKWLDVGGSQLGSRRFYDLGTGDEGRKLLADKIVANLVMNDINILYVIGGDGSLKVAHEIAMHPLAKEKSVVGIPKTMDNDVLWVGQSFGFNTAVGKATEVINILHCEAESTSRTCILELFGAESGFVAASASLASGHVDLVLIPEEFRHLDTAGCQQALDRYIDYLRRIVRDKERAHCVVVLAEGVAKVLACKDVVLGDSPVNPKDFARQLQAFLQGKLIDRTNQSLDVFVNQPRHYIRAIPANAQDQIYCGRLGALAVDNALAGYTDLMISQWLTEYVLVPLDLVAYGQKCIQPAGMFWKQVVSRTGQPCIATPGAAHIRDAE